MKTSNKILLGVISFIGLSMLSVLIFAKGSLIQYEGNSVVGDGKIVRINHQIAEISYLRLRGQYEVYVKKGDTELVIETDENIQAFLYPHDDNYTIYENNQGEEVVNRELRIGQINNLELQPSNGIKIFLTIPSLEKVDLSSTTKLTFEDVLSSESFVANVEDFAEAELKIDTKKLDVRTKGSGILKIEGNIGTTEIEAKDFSELSISGIQSELLNITASGSANVSTIGQAEINGIEASESAVIKAKQLVSKTATVAAKNKANIEVAVTDYLDVNAADSTIVRYSGSPELSSNITAQASLIPIED